MKPKFYLGDAVFAAYNEYGQLVLTTENGEQTTNEIYLEPEVIQALLMYLGVRL